jgi:YesN/AraC family two-component response regulator
VERILNGFPTGGMTMGKYSILLVDDDPFVLNGIGKYLLNRGYAVVTTDSGEGALALLEEKSFHMVITDLAMERVDGIGVAKKAKECNSETMVIILTGYGDLTSAIEAIHLDVDDYILKPCEPLVIGSRVFKCFEKYELNLKIKTYENILPVCCVCKKIRDDGGREPGTGKWLKLESYIWRKSGVAATSCYCPECSKKAKQQMEREMESMGF